MTTSVRVQFSRDLDTTHAEGTHIRARYLESQSAERGEPTTPSADFTFQYKRRPTACLELKFTKPLERFPDAESGSAGRDSRDRRPAAQAVDPHLCTGRVVRQGTGEQGSGIRDQGSGIRALCGKPDNIRRSPLAILDHVVAWRQRGERQLCGEPTATRRHRRAWRRRNRPPRAASRCDRERRAAPACAGGGGNLEPDRLAPSESQIRRRHVLVRGGGAAADVERARPAPGDSGIAKRSTSRDGMDAGPARAPTRRM